MAGTPTLKSFERDNKMFVKGTTVIDHAIRLRYNLTLREYTILATVMELRDGKHKHDPMTYGRFWIASGVKPLHVLNSGRKLIEKGLLYKDDEGLLQVLKEFQDQFKNNSDFEEFWKIAPKGNKQAAMRMYDRAIRQKKHEYICQKYKEYIEFCERTERFKKDTSSWLNPTSGYLDSDWVADENKKEGIVTPSATLGYNFLTGKNE